MHPAYLIGCGILFAVGLLTTPKKGSKKTTDELAQTVPAEQEVVVTPDDQESAVTDGPD